MSLVRQIKALSASQRSTFTACFLGWTLDAFDFFLVTFVVADIAKDFNQDKVAVLGAITLTLASSFLSFLQIAPQWQIGLQGAILIAVLSLRLLVRMKEKRK